MDWLVAELAGLDSIGRPVGLRAVPTDSEPVADVAAVAAEVETLPVAESPAGALQQAHSVFRRWLGDAYDLDSLDAVLAAAAVEKLDGDPVWLLLVSGAGAAKTETVTALLGAGATVTSTITSEGALLSATSSKEKAKDATGGLLRKLGDRGLLVIKDFTSILSMNRDSRAAVLAALREIYDGRWERNVGTDGGRTLTWTGRLVVIGAVTTAYDSAHGVIAAMGDRFALVRIDSCAGRLESGRQALRNVGHETQMRAELAEAAGRVLADVDPARAVLTDPVMDALLAVANLVTLARTACERDYRGDVIEAHAPEAPTRFAKMLAQVVRGALALGADQDHAVTVAMRVAGDSVPPLRLLLLGDVQAHPCTRTTEVTGRVQRPRSTVDRVLQELHYLGLLIVDELADNKGWRYSLAPDVDLTALDRLHTRNVTTPGYWKREEALQVPLGTDKPGVAPGVPLATDKPGAPCSVCQLPVDPALAGNTHPACSPDDRASR